MIEKKGKEPKEAREKMKGRGEDAIKRKRVKKAVIKQLKNK